MFILIYLISFILAVFLPDLWILPLMKYYRGKAPESEENKTLHLLPRHLGWIERALYWLIWFLLKSEFITFIGIWAALKVVGNYKSWDSTHEGRGRYIKFIIGTAVSIISVILISYFTQILIPKLFHNPFNIY